MINENQLATLMTDEVRKKSEEFLRLWLDSYESVQTRYDLEIKIPQLELSLNWYIDRMLFWRINKLSENCSLLKLSKMGYGDRKTLRYYSGHWRSQTVWHADRVFTDAIPPCSSDTFRCFVTGLILKELAETGVTNISYIARTTAISRTTLRKAKNLFEKHCLKEQL